jgi:hypothetical protein
VADVSFAYDGVRLLPDSVGRLSEQADAAKAAAASAAVKLTFLI